MILSSFYIIVLVLLGTALLVYAYEKLFHVDRSYIKKKPKRLKGKPGEAGVCPLCGTLLSQGEQIKSALFPGEADRMCHIFGCPHCHPYEEDDIERKCPVCKKKVPQDGYLVARLFQRPHNKQHVHILGCTGCRMPRHQ